MPNTNQPEWEMIENIGDVNPLDYGGGFVFRDKTGVYPEELEILEVDEEKLRRLDDIGFSDMDEFDKQTAAEGIKPYTIYRIVLDRCTYQDGILSDNKFHPEHPAWWAEPENKRAERPQDSTYLSNVCSSMDYDVEELAGMFCSEDARQRAIAYKSVADYHGIQNFDEYPLEMTRAEVEERYQKDMGKHSWFND